ncbi:Transcription initiation protein spt3 [Microbotryomycetes sp. JL201]|nr:Transcription initiation protein spt3 [Microbotryomycetes sp. JL201]
MSRVAPGMSAISSSTSMSTMSGVTMTTSALTAAALQQAQAQAAAVVAASRPSHIFTSEIQQMAFVFTGDSEIDDDVAQYMEDIIRAQLCEILTTMRTPLAFVLCIDQIVNARLQAARRGARTLAVEDLIFLIRHSKANVERLRSYLSWKDVRKKVKDSEADDELDVEEPAADRALKASKMQVQVPWDLEAIYGEFLPDEDETDKHDEEEEDEHKRRLKHFADVTDKMSKEEYQQYSEARQASFVYRKSKKFRDFLNLSQAIDGALVDDVVDILGFLAYEMVRALCEAGLANRRRIDLAKANAAVAILRQKKLDKDVGLVLDDDKSRKRSGNDEASEGTKDTDTKDPSAETPKDTNSGVNKRIRRSTGAETASPARERDNNAPRRLVPPTSIFSEPVAQPAMPPAVALSAIASGVSATENDMVMPSLEEVVHQKARIKLEDVNAGFLALQQEHSLVKSSGLRNWRGGVARLPTKLV